MACAEDGEGDSCSWGVDGGGIGVWGDVDGAVGGD